MADFLGTLDAHTVVVGMDYVAGDMHWVVDSIVDVAAEHGLGVSQTLDTAPQM